MKKHLEKPSAVLWVAFDEFGPLAPSRTRRELIEKIRIWPDSNGWSVGKYKLVKKS